jgi:hypothetical protein
LSRSIPEEVILAPEFPFEHNCFLGASGTFDMNITAADHSMGAAVGVAPKVDLSIPVRTFYIRAWCVESIHIVINIS